MKRSAWWNPKLGVASTSIILMALHLMLLELLSRFDVVSCIFCAGDHLPKWMIASALLFLIIRLVVYLVLPAVITWRITTFLLGRHTGKPPVPAADKS